MSEKRVCDLFNIKARFLRSAHLERDFDDPHALSGYVVTDFTRSCVERIAEGLKSGSGQRAWRATGDYGSGKSSFALLLAHVLAGRDSALPPQIRKAVDLSQLPTQRPPFAPVLVTCSRQDLGSAVLRGLRRTLSRLYTRGAKSKLTAEIDRLLASKHEPSDDHVLELVLETNSRVIADSKGKGLLLILDELGKFLEFAALHPQRQDVFFLQRLAEAASGSGKAPLFIVCLLHQGFNAYADCLNQSAQREWEKVAGRFEEIVFGQPVEEIAGLIASAVAVNTDEIPRTQSHALRMAMQEGIELGWFGSAPAKGLLDRAASLYPLHPTVLPVLIRVFRRFGQNERSLFSFLLSNEPFGLQAFAQQRLRAAEPYRLHNFYDYVRTNFGHRLVTQSYRSHWNLIESLVESFASEDPLQVQVLKTVGILNLLNDGDLLATEESVVCALTCERDRQKEVCLAVERLRTGKHVLYDRGRARGLCLWPHTSVDLEKAYEDARRSVDTPQRVAAIIKDYLETRPVVARRHYITTGNLRHYDVRYCAVTELLGLLQESAAAADGLIVIPLCETAQEHDVALEFARLPELKGRQHWLVGVPQPLSNLASLIQEVQRWDWVVTNTLELNGDKYAREEVARQSDAARAQLHRRIQALVGFKQLSGQTSLTWFHQNEILKIRAGRHLLEELSRIFDDTYPSAPRIHNELVNRRNLSSAAAAARMRLIEQMFSHPRDPFVGMDAAKKPPEMSMYLSVLKNTGLHQEQDDSTWRIVEPHHRQDKCHVLPTLRHIREIVRREPDARVGVAALFDELRRPPYGVRDGILPILLTAFAIVHEQDVAFFKEGTFQREMTSETMLVLSKWPEKFEIQYCKIEGIRAELFEKLLAVLELHPSVDRKVELLDVVKPLCVFVAQLPEYVRHSRRLSSTALAVRDVILEAREPVRLLFTALPKACGFDPFAADGSPNKSVPLFVKTLKGAVDELRAAYPELQGRLRQRLRDAFDLPGSFQQFRTVLANRAQQVVLSVTETKLKAFCLRLLDDNLAEAEWLESLGSYLGLKPPAKWHDAEEDLFNQELAQLAARFYRVENIVFAGGKTPQNGIGIRLAITRADGVEHEQVIHFTAEEERHLTELQDQFESLLSKDRRLGLAAASRALWTTLDNKRKAKSE